MYQPGACTPCPTAGESTPAPATRRPPSRTAPTMIWLAALLLLGLAVLWLLADPRGGPVCLRGARYILLYHLAAMASVIFDFTGIRDGLKQPPSPGELSGFVAVVTGGARGLGVDVCHQLAAAGARVIVGMRDPATCAPFLEKTKPHDVIVLELDVANMESVKNFAKKVRKMNPTLDLLVNNAGKLFGDHELTVDGFESQLATNFLGHALLTHELLPALRQARGPRGARVVHVSSCAHLAARILPEDPQQTLYYEPHAGYSHSKLAQLMFSLELDRRLANEQPRVRSLAVHPGCVATSMAKQLKESFVGRLVHRLLRSPLQGAMCVLRVCLGAAPSTSSAPLWGSTWASSHARDQAQQQILFNMTCEMLHIENFGNPLAA